MNEVMAVADPQLWASQGGMLGLVILALFVALGLFLYAQSKIYQMHREDNQQLLQLHAEERKQWGAIVDERQKETNAAILSMSAALNLIASKSRHTEHTDDRGSYFQSPR